MTYKAYVVTKKGKPEDVLKIVERELVEPKENELRIKVLAVGIGSTDNFVRTSFDPYVPKFPFTPGAEVVGTVDAVGSGVTKFKKGDHVASLMSYGACTEYIYLPEDFLALVPPVLDPVKAAAIVLEYTTAYQMLHRIAKVREGDKILITGASGAVGRAIMELGNLAKIKMYGLTSPSKAEHITKHGAIPIDYTKGDFVKELRKLEPEGVDYVLDGVAGNFIFKGMGALKRKGKLISFGNPGFWHALLGMGRVMLLAIVPNGKAASIYGIFYWFYSKKTTGRQWIKQDQMLLFNMIQEGKIDPLIYTKLPIMETKKANEILDSGKFYGKIVLVPSELL
jgi:NADPH:quinone reductase-like Zn-dependent oxidoreductase